MIIIGNGSVHFNPMEPPTSRPKPVEDDETKVCAICIEEIDTQENDDTRKLTCGHEFHLHCITPVVVNSFLARKDVICPLCRNVECHTTSMTYQSAYNSLIDLVRSEGHDDLFGDVRIDIESLERLERVDNSEHSTHAHNIPSRQQAAEPNYWFSVKNCMTLLWCGNVIVLSIGFIIMIIVFMRMNNS